MSDDNPTDNDRVAPATADRLVALRRRLESPGALAKRRAGWALTLLRVGSALVLISFGADKFIDHGSETASFRGYGLPVPGASTYAIGLLELIGGVLLAVGYETRVVAALLLADMLGAILISGIVHGETISLTLAPALLIVMLALIWLGPGRASLDGR